MPLEVTISNALCEGSEEFWPHRRPERVGNHSWHDEVDLSRCFQETAVLYSICVVFWILAALRFCCRAKQPSLSYSWLNVTKIVLCAVIVITGLCDLVKTVVDVINDSNEVPNYQIISPIVLLLSAILMIAVIISEKRQGITSSGIQFSFWGALVIYASIKLRSLLLISKDEGHVAKLFYFVTFEIYFTIFLVQFILSFFLDKQSNYQYIEEDDNPCPESSASFLSQLTWWWQNRLIIIGWRRALKNSDLWSLNSRDKSQAVAPQLANTWQQEIDKTGASFYSQSVKTFQGYEKIDTVPSGHLQSEIFNTFERRQTSKPSLLLALIKAFGLPFAVAGLLKVISDLLSFVGPQVLKLLIQYTKDEDEPMWKGYFYAVLLFVFAIIQSLVLQHYFYRCFVVGMHLRTAIISMVYNKSLRLSNSARRQSTVGEIVNLMSVDVQRFMNLVTYLHLIWSAPLQIVLSIVFLYIAMGPSVFAGVGVMILMIPINAIIASISRKLQVTQMQQKDRRIRLMSEVLKGIKVIKLYAWEDHFQDDVQNIRRTELVVLRNTAYLSVMSSFTWTCAPFLVALATFGTFVASGDNRLTADRAFVALSLFNILRFPLSMLPLLISNIVQASVSLKRLSTFLQHDEIDPDNLGTREQPASGSEDAVTVQAGIFSWDRNARPVLENINLNIKAGQLVAVVGHVGAGKSSLISALLGEMVKMTGCVSVKGHVAYIPQQAWIRNATVQDNILFGKPYNMILYGHVIDYCALGPDLEILPAGDQTEIGEKGINLSGGQKQRVSLARAVYQEADVYYFDDPLSAVDSQVGKHIFDKVIGPQGLLKGKTRVLVTHGLSYLPQCDVIVTIENGRISEVGAYAELIDNNGAFAEFVHTYASMEESNEEGEAEVLDYNESEGEEMPLNEDFTTIMSPEDDPETKARRDTHRRFLERQQSWVYERQHSKSEKKAPLKKARFKTDSSSTAELKLRLSRQLNQQKSIEEREMLKKATESSQLIQEEKAESGNVKLSVIWEYIKSCTFSIAFLTLLFYIGYNGCFVGANVWLAKWSTDEDKGNKSQKLSTELILQCMEAPCSCSRVVNLRGTYLGIYAAFGIGQSILVLFASFSLALGGIIASRLIHMRLLVNVLRLPMSFFDATPSGKILNRFSKDIYTIDETIPRSVRAFISAFFSVLSTIFVISFATPLFMTVILPLLVFYLLIQRFYLATSHQLKRLESISRSPIYTHFQETLLGVSSIRAYNHQARFIMENECKVDANQVAYYPGICANRWLAVRLEFVGSLIILFAALFAVIERNSGSGRLDPGLAGLSITYALQVTQALNWMVRMTSELEANIVSVERTKEYAEAPNEAPAIIYEHRPPFNWPSTGRVKFERYSTRYREGLDLVLKEITCDINGGEKVGIVGRTGAGKSSMTLGLFRIIEAAGGSIKIDDHNIALFGLQDLRSRITIIPQDPVLFADTLRANLDPFDIYTDNEVWKCLESAHLKNYVVSLEDKLSYQITEGGENLSVGQRQLVCLGRALLRKTKILVLDEAIAAVDMETDDLIQRTIRTEFADCTVITIAHHLNTIMDYDRIIVLEAGGIVEFGTPQDLLERKGVFHGMARDAGLV